jgi:hypothetical protein
VLPATATIVMRRVPDGEVVVATVDDGAVDPVAPDPGGAVDVVDPGWDPSLVVPGTDEVVVVVVVRWAIGPACRLLEQAASRAIAPTMIPTRPDDPQILTTAVSQTSDRSGESPARRPGHREREDQRPWVNTCWRRRWWARSTSASSATRTRISSSRVRPC